MSNIKDVLKRANHANNYKKLDKLVLNQKYLVKSMEYITTKISDKTIVTALENFGTIFFYHPSILIDFLKKIPR